MNQTVVSQQVFLPVLHLKAALVTSQRYPSLPAAVLSAKLKFQVELASNQPISFVVRRSCDPHIARGTCDVETQDISVQCSYVKAT